MGSSGTNGYVQRNTAHISKGRAEEKFKTEEDIRRLDAQANREPNLGILEHERKRKLEVKCLELEEVLEEQGLNEEEIEEKVTAYRKMLISKEGQKKRFAEVDEFGRPVLKETHQIAEAMKNNKLKDAFGISKHFVEGSSFDINRKELEEAAKEDEKKKRQEEMEEPRREKAAKAKKKKRAASSSSESEDSEEEERRRKKKNKRKSRSGSRGKNDRRSRSREDRRKRSRSGRRSRSRSRGGDDDHRRRNYSREEKRRSRSRSRGERRRKSKERRRSRSSSEEVKVKAEKTADNGGIEWRSKDGGLSGGTRQRQQQVEVKEEPASPARDEKEEEEEAIVVRHRIDSPSPPRRSRRGGSSPSPVKEPSTRRGRGVEEDTRRMRVE